MAPMKETSPTFDGNEEEKEFYNISVAGGIVYLIYSEFQGRRKVLPEALGGAVQRHPAEAAGKAAQT